MLPNIYKDCVPALGTNINPGNIREAAFSKPARDYQRCSKCVMDTTDPEIVFAEDGECNHCKYFKTNIMPAWPNKNERDDLLKKLITEIKSNGKGKEYDCILGLSGGVDSSYVAVKVAEYKLRPLVVHVDAGWNSALAVKNIEQICERLKFDLVTHVVNWEEMKELQLAFLRSNVANQDVPQDHAFFAALYGCATKSGIQYVISGSNFATESVLPQSWGYDAMDATHLISIHKQFGSKSLGKFPIVSFYDLFIRYPFFKKMKVVKPLNLIEYNKDQAIEELEQNYGWQYYGGKHYESRWTRFFQGHYLPYKFGYDKRKAHLSSLILSGQMNREKALSLLDDQLYDPNLLIEDKEFIAKKLGISLSQLDEFLNASASHFSHFPNHQTKLKICLAIFGTLRKYISLSLAIIRLPLKITKKIFG